MEPCTQRRGPGPLKRRIGRAINVAVVHWPRGWPLLRGPVERFFDAAAAGWDERVRPDTAEHLLPLATAVRIIERPPARVLDVGTGTGAGAFMLAERFPQADVLGIDISAAMIERAGAKLGGDRAGRVRFAVADITTLEAPSGGFDLIVMLNMPPFFAPIARLLAPGGNVAWASSHGSGTPFYTSARALVRGFQRCGVHPLGAGEAGAGTYYLGRLTAGD